MNNANTDYVHLAMFAKYWESGKVKTRLARTIGNEAAREIHLLFVRFILRQFQGFGDRRTLVATPVEHQQQFEGILPEPWRLQFQSAGDLGQRMSHFFESNENPGQVNILIGSDTPDLPIHFLQKGVELLKQNQLVLGPSQDGGYYLIAMQEHLPELFRGVSWSSPEVLAQTLEIARKHSIAVELLPELNDVDEIDDLRQLMEKLGNSRELASRELYEALARLELPIG